MHRNKATATHHRNITETNTDVHLVPVNWRLSSVGAGVRPATVTSREEDAAETGRSHRGESNDVEPTPNLRESEELDSASPSRRREERTRNANPEREPTNAPPRARPSKSQGRRTRATIAVGTLNMRGAGAATHGGVGEKWLRINQVVRDSKVAILGLQETHLVDEKREELNELFNMSMMVYSTADPENPTGARGVAIAVNKRLVNTDDAVCRVVVPGRALHLTVKWSRQNNLTILVIYAPNDPRHNESFWEEIQSEMRSKGLANPGIMMGDFNIVESPMDRYPPRPDQASAVEALQRACQRMRLKDEWRARYKDEREYTYLQTATGSQSRIDRMYLDPRMTVNAVEWDTVGPGFTTDHQLVRCVFTNRDKPYIGRGRWRMHSMLLTDNEFSKQVKARGMRFQDELTAMRERSEQRNPQTLYASFKKDVRSIAMARAKERVPKIERKIEAMRKDMKEMNKKAVADGEDAEAACKAALLQSEIAELEMKRFGNKRAAVAARDWLEGETISKYWMRLNKTSNADKTVYELAKLGTGPATEYASRSETMAEIAKDHYNRNLPMFNE
ncbi:DNase I-like protein [Lentinus brumalis]|uniref:DNase I-like protein n=1 Tax=Lentinus brumalis TaxID=2498619 RepID=A0A371CMN3_9APHY|nr:DNase I-like protein [Polyporus brumalis]